MQGAVAEEPEDVRRTGMYKYCRRQEPEDVRLMASTLRYPSMGIALRGS